MSRAELREAAVVFLLLIAWTLLSFGLATESRPLVVAALPSLGFGIVLHLAGMRKTTTTTATNLAKLKDAGR